MGVGVERGVMVGEGEEGGSEMTRRGKVEEENKENSEWKKMWPPALVCSWKESQPASAIFNRIQTHKTSTIFQASNKL